MRSYKNILFLVIGFFLIQAKALKILENPQFIIAPNGEIENATYPLARGSDLKESTKNKVRGSEGIRQWAIDSTESQEGSKTIFEAQHIANDNKEIDFRTLNVTRLSGSPGNQVTSSTSCTRKVEKQLLKSLDRLSCYTLTEKFCAAFSEKKAPASVILKTFAQENPDYQKLANLGMNTALTYSDGLFKLEDSRLKTYIRYSNQIKRDAFQPDPKAFFSRPLDQEIAVRCQDLQLTKPALPVVTPATNPPVKALPAR